jgi:hypothetical protein
MVRQTTLGEYNEVYSKEAESSYLRQTTPEEWGYHEWGQQSSSAVCGFMPQPMMFMQRQAFFVPMLSTITSPQATLDALPMLTPVTSPQPTMDSLPPLAMDSTASTVDSLPVVNQCHASSGARSPSSSSNQCESQSSEDEEPRHTSTNVKKANDVRKKLWSDEAVEADAVSQVGVPSANETISSVRGLVSQLSFESTGCRMVQLALDLAETDVASELASELRGRVLEAIISPHGNYVIQKMCQVLPAAHSNFIFEEIRGNVAIVARHRYGCRILCRIVEHLALEPLVLTLIDELLTEADDLCRHSFAHHVLQSVLEHSPGRQQQMIVDALCFDLHRNVRSRNAGFVIQKVLAHSAAPDLRQLVAALLQGGPCGLAVLAKNRHAPQVAQLLDEVPSAAGMPGMLGALEFRLSSGKALGTRHGKRLLKGAWQGDGKASPAAAARSALVAGARRPVA